jgi:hypothetical protein
MPCSSPRRTGITEWTLQQQGFDFCYDKRLYDRLVNDDAAAVRLHMLGAGTRLPAATDPLHREPRRAPRRGGSAPGRGRVAAVVVATLPGATLWHEGQFDGRRDAAAGLPRTATRRARRRGPTRLPSPVDRRGRFQRHARRAVATARRHRLAGQPHPPEPPRLVLDRRFDTRHLVVVNFSDAPAQGRVPLPWPDLAGRPCRLTDLLADLTYDRDGDELVDPGLYVELEGLRWHLVAVVPRS